VQRSQNEAVPQPAVSFALSFGDPHRLIDRISRLCNDPNETLDLARWYSLYVRAQSLRSQLGFDTLLAPLALSDRLEVLPHQLRVAQRVLRDMAPAAILADEVGLGKTIEAGLIYKELALRGAVRSALILAPKSVLGQWKQELDERFDEQFVMSDDRSFRGFDRETRVICSLSQFVRSFDRVAARPWDMVIVDEAHLLANPDSKRRRYAAQLRVRWRLLLTATPISNRLIDLYSLVDLVSPGRFGTQREFEMRYVADMGTARVLRPERAEELRAVVGSVMCRTRRADAGIHFAGRAVYTRSIEPDPQEDALISDVTDYLRALYRRLPVSTKREAAPLDAGSGPTKPRNRGMVVREIMALQQSLSSSPQAIEMSLRRRAEKHPDEEVELIQLADRCQTIKSAKKQLLLTVLSEIGSEPAVIFTLRLETAYHLRDTISQTGRRPACYVGALSRQERDTLIAQFTSGEIDTLIATDAGAEGLNLHQRCHTVFNYDLHWNPMRIEQRIGRVHRLGQEQDVAVYNFSLRDTIDDYVLRLLFHKINLFTMTVGELEAVLSEVQEGELDFEERILESLLCADAPGDLQAEMEALAAELDRGSARLSASASLTMEALG